MEMLLYRYKDIDVVISQNDDMTFGALTAIQNAGLTAGEDGDIMVISFDAVKAGFSWWMKGWLPRTSSAIPIRRIR